MESIHRDDGPARELEPRNDELVAIEGGPIGRDCGPADFDALLLKLKGASRPLKLTSVRAGSMSQTRATPQYMEGRHRGAPGLLRRGSSCTNVAIGGLWGSCRTSSKR